METRRRQWWAFSAPRCHQFNSNMRDYLKPASFFKYSKTRQQLKMSSTWRTSFFLMSAPSWIIFLASLTPHNEIPFIFVGCQHQNWSLDWSSRIALRRTRLRRVPCIQIIRQKAQRSRTRAASIIILILKMHCAANHIISHRARRHLISTSICCAGIFVCLHHKFCVGPWWNYISRQSQKNAISPRCKIMMSFCIMNHTHTSFQHI